MLEKQSKPLLISSGLILLAIIGYVDHLTEHELSLSVFYVFPIYLFTWAANRRSGFAISIASASVLILIDIVLGHLYSHPLTLFWNNLIRFVSFIIITSLLSSLKTALQHEKELSHTDHLTGVSNSRYFYNMVKMEINRLERTHHPFTVAYIDVDNFKSINDKFGHTEGDKILLTIVNIIKTKIRNTDLLARLGGDEFAIFFPDTDQESTQAIIRKINDNLVREMKEREIKATLSIGVLTCLIPPHGVDQLIKAADNLMYDAKQCGKNSVRYSMYESQNIKAAQKETG